MKLFIFSIFILGILFPNFSRAQHSKTCSPDGYTILLVNGIFTTEAEAKANKDSFTAQIDLSFKSQPVTIDFIYNPTHSKTIDLFDVAKQKLFDNHSINIEDYDFVKIYEDASRKVGTQKVLLLGHSQGNFYINALHDALSDEPGGVPSTSLGIYGVASPASRVSGGGKYINSLTDKVIYGKTSAFFTPYLLPGNADIKFKESDGDPNGHSFSKIYLAHEGERMRKDIEGVLRSLKSNSIQDEFSPCILPPERTITQNIQGAMLAVADPVLSSVEYGVSETYKVGTKIGNEIIGGAKYLASGFGSFFKSVAGIKPGENTASVIPLTPEENKKNSQAKEALIPKEAPKPKQEKTVLIQENTRENIEIKTAEEIKEIQPVQVVAYTGGGSSHSTPSDTTPPVITIIGDNPETVFQNSAYVDQGASAVDENDGEVSVSVDQDVDTLTIGTYTVTYSASDDSGNTANAIRTVNVVAEDLTAPDIPVITTTTEFINTDTISITGEAEDDSVITITGGLQTAIGISVNGEFSVEVYLNQNTENTLLITSTDGSSNESSPAIFSVTHDNIAPVISRAFMPASLTYNVALVGGTVQLNIETDGPDYEVEAITINDISTTDFFHIGANTYGAKRIIVLGEESRASGAIPVSIVLKDKAGNINIPFTEDEDHGLSINGQFPSSSNQIIPQITSEGRLSEDVFLDCVTKSGFYFLYSVDENSIFRFISSSDLGINCSGGEYKIMDSGQGFIDQPWYVPVVGWYYGGITIGGRHCDLGQSGQVCSQGPFQSFFRIHRDSEGVWISD